MVKIEKVSISARPRPEAPQLQIVTRSEQRGQQWRATRSLTLPGPSWVGEGYAGRVEGGGGRRRRQEWEGLVM